MAVFATSLLLKSTERSCAELAELVGAAPTCVSEKGTPVSSRNPDGPVRGHSTCSYESGLDPDDLLNDHVAALAPLLERLAAGVPDDVSRELSVGVTARPLGYLFGLGPEAIALLAQAGCGLLLDVYNDDEADE